VEGGIERAVEHLERAARRGADHSRDGVAVAWSPGQCFEDEDVERSLQEIRFAGHIPSRFEGIIRSFPRMSRKSNGDLVRRDGDTRSRSAY
jgi:hypothetical protein